MRDVAVIIPSLDGEPTTLESVPASCETAVVTEGNRAEARNIGVERTNSDILAFCDDDIAFDPHWFGQQIQQLQQGEFRGLKDFGAGYVLTRFLLVHRDDFTDVGGFDEQMDHMEDTEWAMRAVNHGLKMHRLSRSHVAHTPHENDVDRQKRLRALEYLTQKHGLRALPLLWSLV